MPFQHPLAKLTTRQLLIRILGFPQRKAGLNLQEAAKYGNENVVRQAIEAGCELNGIDGQGCSTLQLAAGSGCSDIFAMLLEAGAEPNIVIPPPSLADVCMVSCRLLNQSFNIILCGWIASKLYVPVPSFIVRNVGVRAFTHLLALPALYWLSAGLLLRFYPTVYSGSQLVIEALSAFQGNAEEMFTLFLDADPDLSFEEIVLLWSHAVERGYTGTCQRLLRYGFPVDSFYPHYDYPDAVTALLHACGASHLELVLLLLGNGADPTLLDNHGRSCILMASARPYVTHAGSEADADAIIKVLLGTDAAQHIDTVQKDEDPEVKDFSLAGRYGWPLADVSQNLRINAVWMLLEAGADPNLKDDSGWTALNAACRWHVRDGISIARLLVLYGADVNAMSNGGWTPLGCAASIGSFVELAEILIDAGAHLESVAGEATTALQMAARHDISGGEVVKYLVRKGANVNATGGRWGSPLLATLERPQSFFPDDGSVRTENPESQIIDFVLEFLKHGLDVNLVPEGRRCAVQVAAENNLPLVVSLLIQHGANIPSFECEAQSTLPLAQSKTSGLRRTVPQASILSYVRLQSHGVFSVLLDHGVSPDADSIQYSDDPQMTLLGAACTSNDEDLLTSATLLLEHGADPNFTDLHGHLPIQRAAYAVSLGHLQKLVEYRASVEIDSRDEYGSLLHSLCKGYAKHPQTQSLSDSFLECFRFLDLRLPRGTVWSQDGVGRTCLHYLAETAEETHLVAKADGSFSQSDSAALSILHQFLDRHGRPHLLELVPNPPLEVFLLPDRDGRLAFHVLALQGDVQAITGLIEHVKGTEMGDEWEAVEREAAVSALLTQRDNRGWNALHYAASEGQAFACQILLQVGEMAALTAAGETAADLANKNRHYQVAEYITSYVAGTAGDQEAMERANVVLARAARKKLAYEFTESQLMETLAAERERIGSSRAP